MNVVTAVASAIERPSGVNPALAFDGLSELLARELEHHAWADAFILAARMNEAVEDFLHRDPISFAQRCFEPSSGLAVAARAGMAAICWHLRNRRFGTARLIRWQQDFAVFVLRLAEMVVCPAVRPCISAEELLEVSGLLLAEPGVLPAQLWGALSPSLSACRGFAERPDGWQQILESFLADSSHHRRRLLVVGIRPSGSCLAPLVAAHLGLHGCANVRVLTLSAGDRLLPGEKAEISETARKKGLVMVTGAADTAQEARMQITNSLVCAGCEARSILLLNGLFEPRVSPVPRALPWPLAEVGEKNDRSA